MTSNTPTPARPALENVRAGQLATMNDKDSYFRLAPVENCEWRVQLWMGDDKDGDMLGRIYGPTPEIARDRAASVVAALRSLADMRDLVTVGQKILAKLDSPAASVTQWDADELRAALARSAP